MCQSCHSGAQALRPSDRLNLPHPTFLRCSQVDLVDPIGDTISLVAEQATTSLVDAEPPDFTESTELDLGSTKSTCLPNTQNLGISSDVAVDPPSTFGLPESTSESTEAPQPAVEQELTVAIATSAASTPEPHTLGIHDFVIDKSGRLAEIAKFARGGWLTNEDQHISRDDLKVGVYTKINQNRADLPLSLLSAIVLVGFASDINSMEMLLALTQDWSGEHKKEVWRYLSPKLQAKYLALRDAVT